MKMNNETGPSRMFYGDCWKCGVPTIMKHSTDPQLKAEEIYKFCPICEKLLTFREVRESGIEEAD